MSRWIVSGFVVVAAIAYLSQKKNGILGLATASAASKNGIYLSDGRKVVCSSETFNCPSPSYRKNIHKKLKTCADVKLVYDTCMKVAGRDVHDLDRDDGHPCDEDCHFD